MAVVTRYASGAKDPNSITQDRLPAEEVQGHAKRLISTIEVVNGDNATSVYYLGRIPANARIGRGAVLLCDAIAGLTDIDVGTPYDPNCLLANNDPHAGSTAGISLSALFDIAVLNKPFYKNQTPTPAADPFGDLDIILTINHAPTAGGTVTVDIPYYTP
jgi:hypothetical protein